MAPDLAADLAALSPGQRAVLTEAGVDAAAFAALADRVLSRAGNRVTGRVTPCEPSDLLELPPPGSAAHRELEERGREALARGECALVVLAGGMATRMGGQVKALVEALPGRTFLELRLSEQRELERRTGRCPPLWLMSSASTDAALRRALDDTRVARSVRDPSRDAHPEEIAVFRQDSGFRLTPSGRLFLAADGDPSLYSTGHGDLPDALRRSGLLQRFVERGGRVLTLANLDNLGAWLDPVVLGQHLAGGAPLTCEVVDKVGTDRGGIPVRLDGHAEVLEEFRLPAEFDAAAVRVFNTNTFHVDARALLELRAPWTWFAVEKKVEGQPVIQLERLLGELTAMLPTRFLRVPRAGTASRFLPVKDLEELAARAEEIRAVLTARGTLTPEAGS